MVARIDLVGQKFGRLTATEFLGGGKYRCECECGEVKDFYTQNLKRGLSKSCGCLNSELLKKRWAEHESTFDKEAYAKRYYAENSEARRAKAAKWRELNPLLNSEGKRKCYQAKREHYLARVKAGYAADPEAYITRQRLKYDMKKEATPKWADSKAIKEIYIKARKMTKETGVKYHVDHVIPLNSDLVCGLHCEANLQVITAEENWRKHNSFTR